MTNKNIYLSTFNDISYFNLFIKNFVVFDKKTLMIQSNVRMADKSLFTYLENNIIQKEITKTLKNKKITNIIYILYDTEAKTIVHNLNNFIKPNLSKSISMSFFVLPDDKSIEPIPIT